MWAYPTLELLGVRLMQDGLLVGLGQHAEEKHIRWRAADRVDSLNASPMRTRVAITLPSSSFGPLSRRYGRFALLEAIVVAFPRAKEFAIDVLVWCNLNHHRTVRGSNIRTVHCHISLLLVEAAAVTLLRNGSQHRAVNAMRHRIGQELSVPAP
jgi:hypothetical protein